MEWTTIISFDLNYLIEITGGFELDIEKLSRIAIRVNKRKYRMFVDMMSTMDSLIRVGIKNPAVYLSYECLLFYLKLFS